MRSIMAAYGVRPAFHPQIAEPKQVAVYRRGKKFGSFRSRRC
jgi:hypothetical protein